MDDLFDEWSGIDWSTTPNVDTSGINLNLAIPEGSYGGFDLSGLGDSFGFDIGDLGDLSGSFDLGDLAGWGADVGIGQGDVSDYIPETTYTTEETPFSPQDVEVLPGYVPSEISTDAEAQPGGFYGNTPNAKYDPATNITTIRDDAGNVIRTVQGPPITTGGGAGGSNIVKDLVTKINSLTGGKDNTALLAAILGGVMGLLGKTNQPKVAGYKGGIPKYTAARGQAIAPTAGGRRPGGAGIPSLTGGVTYTKAAHGGLMGLKQGQYLDGATDGMADKIQTSIDGKQPARLSHGEFVVPADVVSHLGNGNSDAGADVLYDMMAKVRKARTGNSKQGKQINPRKYLPA